MDSQVIKALAEQISSQVVFDWKFYVWIVALSFIGGSLGTYLTSYLKTRGVNFATKTDFEQLLAQLSKTTEATENIKTSIKHEYWKAQKQWDFKHDIYKALLESVSKWQSSLRNLIYNLTMIKSVGLKMTEKEVIAKVDYEINHIKNAYAEILKCKFFAGMILSESNLKKMDGLESAIMINYNDSDNLANDIEKAHSILNEFANEIIIQAKNDLMKID